VHHLISHHDPGLILVETSGLSDPVAIAEYFGDRRLMNRANLARTVCLVDAENYLKVSKINRTVMHQVMAADDILINKTDLVAESEIIKARESVRMNNPLAAVTETVMGKADARGIFLKNEPAEAGQKPQNIIPITGRPDTHVGVIRSTRKISRDRAEAFLREFLPFTARLKGYMLLDNGNILAAQGVFDRLELKEIPGNGRNTELVAIGEKFQFHEFSKRFRELCN
jgi:G3E family GTPase